MPCAFFTSVWCATGMMVACADAPSIYIPYNRRTSESRDMATKSDEMLSNFDAGGLNAAPPSSSPAGSDDPLEQLQHWGRVFGQVQQAVLEKSAEIAPQMGEMSDSGVAMMTRIAEIQAAGAQQGLAYWQEMLAGGGFPTLDAEALAPKIQGDRRFADPDWTDNPVYSLILQTYLLVSEAMMRMADQIDGIAPHEKAQLRFATRSIIDAASPANFPITNPAVMKKTIETGGQNLLAGVQRMMADIERGQLRQTDTEAFTVGGNVAVTPGKVVAETPLYQLIQYSPTTAKVYETPLIIFPPWINRFYILDLSPQKSFVQWAVDQGLTVFIVSWKSADASMADVTWDDYVVRGQVQAIDTVRDLLDVESVHAIGYCVAGTTLAATLAWLDANGRGTIVKSATFFTAQVDFSEAGDLSVFVDDRQIEMLDRLTTDGFLDGRFLAATFNMLRGNDLIWSYVVNNYLLGEDYKPFDLLFWNGDPTNLPARWLKGYLTDLYRDNRLVVPGSMVVDGTPIELSRVKVPAYIQAGVEDHIAPAASVWKAMGHFTGPRRFVLAGSGHIAGVVNPPASGKYQFWTCEEPVDTLTAFRERAVETRGSWWPDWIVWIDRLAPDKVAATKARRPGKGKLPAIEDAPGRYVKSR